jgi:hypothetical protein
MILNDFIITAEKKKARARGKCQAWTMMHWEADKTVKRSAHHVPLRQRKRYVRWTSEKSLKKHTQVTKQLPKLSLWTQSKSCLTFRIRIYIHTFFILQQRNLGCAVGWEKGTDESTINRHGVRQPTNRRSNRPP